MRSTPDEEQAMSGVGAPPCLASIHIYPLKAGRAVDLHESAVEPWGLAGDRRWLVVDDGGRFVSQREEPALGADHETPRPSDRRQPEETTRRYESR
jgi:uncharacterized protein YcbX